MDREMLLQHLALSERHVAEGRGHIEKQERIVAELDRDGHNTFLARDLLETLLETQRAHEEHRERILKELQTAT